MVLGLSGREGRWWRRKGRGGDLRYGVGEVSGGEGRGKRYEWEEVGG